MRELWRELWREEEGLMSAETALLLGLVAIVAIGAWYSFGHTTRRRVRVMNLLLRVLSHRG